MGGGGAAKLLFLEPFFGRKLEILYGQLFDVAAGLLILRDASHEQLFHWILAQ